MHNTTALIIVDVQNDFLPPHGALAVSNGNEIIPYILSILNNYSYVIATQDWHPEGHKSFASSHPSHAVGDTLLVNGVSQFLWPDHCIQNTKGSEFPTDIKKAVTTNLIHAIIKKGSNLKIDSYSGFFDNNKAQQTELHTILQEKNINKVHICGLATDYCVKYTVLDALFLEYTTTLLQKGCRAVNLNEDDEQQAIQLMKNKGAKIL